MRILFARIGWMNFYSGSQPGDERPIGGGNYNVEHKGGELYNFKKFGVYLYGAFANAMSAENLNLSRIQPGFKGNKLNDVLIVFFSQHPDKNIGQVVVGWYKKSTVTKDLRTEKLNGIRRWYWAKAKAKDCTLLPTYNRVLQIPRGQNSPGQSNTFFIYQNDGTQKKLKWLEKVIAFVNSYDGPNLINQPEAEALKQIENKLLEEIEASSAQGKILDFNARKVIENRAMNEAIKFYKSKGYIVKNVSANKSYDLECTKDSQNYFVEVKGSTLTIDKIILTFNEVRFAEKHSRFMKLFILHSIKLSKIKNIYHAKGGVRQIIDDWEIDKKRLKPIQYLYQVL